MANFHSKIINLAIFSPRWDGPNEIDEPCLSHRDRDRRIGDFLIDERESRTEKHQGHTYLSS